MVLNVHTLVGRVLALIKVKQLILKQTVMNIKLEKSILMVHVTLKQLIVTPILQQEIIMMKNCHTAIYSSIQEIKNALLFMELQLVLIEDNVIPILLTLQLYLIKMQKYQLAKQLRQQIHKDVDTLAQEIHVYLLLIVVLFQVQHHNLIVMNSFLLVSITILNVTLFLPHAIIQQVEQVLLLSVLQ
jgi:hypothetical protein